MEDFLANKYQTVAINGRVSKWAAVIKRVPQGSILDPLFLIFINDLSNELSSNPRRFADDTCLFSVVRDTKSSANALNNDLPKINN